MMRRSLPAAFTFALAATLSAGAFAFAQAPVQAAPAPDAAPATPATTRTPNPHRQALNLAHRLSLTADQTSKLEPILADRDQKIAALRGDNSLTGKALKQQMHAIRKSTLSQLGTVLTPDQLNQLKSIERAHAHPGQAQPAAAPAA